MLGAVAAYEDKAADGTAGDLTTTDDENESGDEEQQAEEVEGKTSGGGGARTGSSGERWLIKLIKVPGG